MSWGHRLLVWLFLFSSGASADIMWESEFDQGLLNVSSVQCDDAAYPPVLINLSSGQGAVSIDYHQPPAAVLRKRCEILRQYVASPGSERWLAYSITIPTDFQIDPTFMIVMQIHSNPDSGEPSRCPMISHEIVGNTFRMFSRWDANALTTGSTGTCAGMTGSSVQGRSVFENIAFVPGQTYRFVVHVGFSYSTGGFTDVYLNGNQIASVVGPVGYNDASPYYMKNGIYRPSQSWTNGVTERHLLFSDIRIGDANSSLAEMNASRSEGYVNRHFEVESLLFSGSGIYSKASRAAVAGASGSVERLSLSNSSSGRLHGFVVPSVVPGHYTARVHMLAGNLSTNDPIQLALGGQVLTSSVVLGSSLAAYDFPVQIANYGDKEFVVALSDSSTGASSPEIDDLQLIPDIPSDIVLDAESAKGVDVIGSWLTSTGASGFLGSSFLSDRGAADAKKSVSIPVNVPLSGTYEIFIHYPIGAKFCPSVPVDIKGTGKLLTRNIDESVGGGAWISLGSRHFAADTSGQFLRVRNSLVPGRVNVDAFKLKFQSPN